MPNLTQEQFNKLISEINLNAISLTLKIPTFDENEAKRYANIYIKEKRLEKKSPLIMYYIISLLTESEKINFIKEHYNYIKENDEDVFLYDMLSPVSLAYYFSFENIKELYQLDKEIFMKIIKRNQENLFHGFTHEQYLEFYRIFKNEINQIENIDYINSLYHHNRCCYDNQDIENVYNRYTLQKTYNQEFIKMNLKEYDDKINSFSSNEINLFLNYIEDINIYENLLIKHKEKLSRLYQELEPKVLNNKLSELSDIKQEILFKHLKESIIKQENIKKIIFKLSIKLILELYNERKDLFEEFTLSDWIKISSKKRILNKELKDIIDSYEITNIEELFDIKFYINAYFTESIEPLKYIEQKYRKNIISTKLNQLTEQTSIFSKEYFENLNYFKVNKISKDNQEYKKHFILFLEYFKMYKIELNLTNLKELEILFKKIVNGTPISTILETKKIEEIALINRIGDIEFDPKDFTIEQIKKYNVKKHKQLNKIVNSSMNHKSLTLKLMLIVGFDNAKKILECNNSIPVLEHLVGNINVKNIKLNEQGESILNKKIVNMLFKNDKYKEMLNNQNSDLYKYFPRIFNDWDIIKINGKDKNLNSIIEFLKGDSISLEPKYYRLEGLFKYIGCNEQIVQETLKLHDETLKRKESTIPRIYGSYNEYTYEILKYDDMLSLALGNITDCCFTVLGVSYQCLRHALTSKNGRIFVIRKNNEIIAHSWIWRNGNHLCFDNIETSKNINEVDFLNIYLEASEQLINQTYKCEKENAIQNITIGVTNFDKKINGIEEFQAIIKGSFDINQKHHISQQRIQVSNMPKPLEEINYSDSKNIQILIKGNANIKSYQSEYLYQDEQKEIIYYNDNKEYEDEYINELLKILNALRYIKYEQENKLDEYETISIYEINETYCTNEWYIIEYKDGYIEQMNVPQNILNEIKLKNKTLIKK